MLDRNMLARPAPIVILLVLVSLLLYWPTVISLLRIWTDANRPMYSHGLLLVTISLILSYREGKKVPVELDPNTWGLLALATTSFVWLLAYLGQVQIVQQLSLLAVIGGLLWAVLGYRNAKRFAFPVLLLLFAMPFWEFLIVSLQHLTANVVTVLLNNTGITSVLDDTYINIPAGTFEVAPGCSGLTQFIVAMMVAALYGHVNELSLKNTLALTGIAMLVAIATNTLRIYIVVVAGELTNMQHYLVTGDHQILGWVLFGIGMVVLLLWSNRYMAPTAKTSPKPEQHPLAGQRTPNSPAVPPVNTGLRTMALALAALAVGPVLAHVYVGQSAPVSALSLAIPERISVWRATGASSDGYRPRFHGADAEYDMVYQAPSGANVYVYVAYYARQEQGKEAVYDANEVYDGTYWKSIGVRTREFSEQLTVEETRIRSQQGQGKIVWRWYYVNGSRTSNDYMAKILNVLGTLRGDPSVAAIVIAADTNGNTEKTRSVLTHFATDTLAKLERGVENIQPR